MSSLFLDIRDKKTTQLPKQRVKGFSEDEFLYADHTVCVTTTANAMNELLDLIETAGNKLAYT